MQLLNIPEGVTYNEERDIRIANNRTRLRALGFVVHSPGKEPDRVIVRRPRKLFVPDPSLQRQTRSHSAAATGADAMSSDDEGGEVEDSLEEGKGPSHSMRNACLRLIWAGCSSSVPCWHRSIA
mgnify:CR=1 FL=1|jgi:hypothetical protein